MEDREFITPQGLQQLKNYSYKPGKPTIIDKLLNPYWQWVVTLVPSWVAPNLITFIGWIFMVVSYVIILCYDYTFQKDIPSWCFLFTSASIWIYSTLDAIDGKQARKTKSSSPLGQLFDHGCDSFTLTFMILSLAQATKLSGLQTFIFFSANHIAFWNANWMEYNTGVLQTNVGQFGVTQAQLMGAAVHLITGIFGQNIWHTKLGQILPEGWITSDILQSTLGLTVGGFTVYYFGGLILFSGLYLFLHTLITAQDKKKCIRQCFTFYLVLILLVVWVNTSFYQTYRGMVLLNFGLIFSLIVCKVIISSVTKMKLPFFHQEAIPTVLGTISLAACQFYEGYEVMEQLFWCIFLVNIFIILLFLTRAIQQITVHLGIYCFSLKKRPQLKIQ